MYVRPSFRNCSKGRQRGVLRNDRASANEGGGKSNLLIYLLELQTEGVKLYQGKMKSWLWLEAWSEFIKWFNAGFSLVFFRVVQHHLDCLVHNLDNSGMQLCTTCFLNYKCYMEGISLSAHSSWSKSRFSHIPDVTWSRGIAFHAMLQAS